MNFIAHPLVSFARARIRMSADFCWIRINARVRILSMSRFVSDTNDRISLREIRLFGRYREPEKRQHREINNARGNIVARYVSVRIPSLTLSIVLDLRGWSTPALNLSLTDGVIICIEYRRSVNIPPWFRLFFPTHVYRGT